MDPNQWVIQPNNDPVESMCKNIEGWGPFSNERIPDFTPCFEDTAITFIPYAFVLVAGMARLWILSKRESLSTDITKNWLYFTKMGVLLLLLFLNVYNFVVSVTSTGMDWIDNAQILAQGVSVFMTLYIIVLHHVEYTRNRISSAVLLFYWLFVIIADGVKLRTRLMSDQQHEDPIHFGLFAVEYLLSFLVFVLENIPKPMSQ
jgi:hypothetical protein